MTLSLGVRLGEGGEGAVHTIVGRPGLVAKVFHTPPSAEKIAHLQHLIAHASDRLTRHAAWPIALEQTDDGRLALVIPEISGARPIHDFYGVGSRVQKFPGATWADAVRIARQIAHIIAAVHRAGFILADINEENFLLDGAADPKLIDCDSIMSTHDGRTTYGGPYRDEWLPPELIGERLGEIQRTANHDNYALANMIFRLLMMGRQPFAGVPIGARDPDDDEAVRNHHFSYAGMSALIAPPPTAPPFAMLPPKIQQFFVTAFGRDGRLKRPTAAEWTTQLFRLERSLEKCRVVPFRHRYAKHLGDQCPWCALAPVFDAYPDQQPAPQARPAAAAAAAAILVAAVAQGRAGAAAVLAAPLAARRRQPPGGPGRPARPKLNLSLLARVSIVAMVTGTVATAGIASVFLMEPVEVSAGDFPVSPFVDVDPIDDATSKVEVAPAPASAADIQNSANATPVAVVKPKPKSPDVEGELAGASGGSTTASSIIPRSSARMKSGPRPVRRRVPLLRYPANPLNEEVGVCIRLWIDTEGRVDRTDVLRETAPGYGYGAIAAEIYAGERYRPARDIDHNPMPGFLVYGVVYERPPWRPAPRVVIPIRVEEMCRVG